MSKSRKPGRGVIQDASNIKPEKPKIPWWHRIHRRPIGALPAAKGEGFIQAEVILLRNYDDHPSIFTRSFVIPLPGDRAFRFGWNLNWHAYIGPRRYKLRATRQFVEGFARIGGGDIEKTKEGLRAIGVEIEGDLRPVEDNPDDTA